MDTTPMTPVNQGTTTNRTDTTRPRQDTGLTPQFRIEFGSTQLCEITGFCIDTLRHWMRKGWVRPTRYGVKRGQGFEHRWSSWQLVGFAIVAAAMQEAKVKGVRVGYAGVRRAMEALSGRSDEELLSEDQQSMHVAERASAVAHSALNSALLTEAMYDNLAKALEAIDRKARSTLM